MSITSCMVKPIIDQSFSPSYKYAVHQLKGICTPDVPSRLFQYQTDTHDTCMAALTAAALQFTVRRQPAVLVAPAAPTPRELKRLSDVDDQEGLRLQVPFIMFYRRDTSTEDGRDPARVIRDAISKALVHYYPFAGRLRELEGRKLAVDCNGKGILFIEANADVGLEQFGDALHPPFPCFEELLFDAPGSSAILDAPLLLVQVTRLTCGAFVLAVRLNHTVADAPGLVRFLRAVAELARGAAVLTVQPVWSREILEARNPPRPSFAHREYDDGVIVPVQLKDDMEQVQRSFFFGPPEVAAIRARLPPHLRKSSSTFEIITGSLWKCRTMALSPDAEEETRLMFAVSAGQQGGKTRLRVPDGYYGNTIVYPVAISKAGELRARPVGYAVELVRKAKEQVNAEYAQSVADLMVLRGRRPGFALGRHGFMVSDFTRLGFTDLDYGWGRPVYAPSAKGYTIASFLGPLTNSKGEDGVVVPMCLPGPAMDRFVEEMGKLVRLPVDAATAKQPPGVLLPAKMSAL
ncbi:hypothetical protein EJB05_53046, partial [Eragrostis curvula]